MGKSKKQRTKARKQRKMNNNCVITCRNPFIDEKTHKSNYKMVKDFSKKCYECPEEWLVKNVEVRAKDTEGNREHLSSFIHYIISNQLRVDGTNNNWSNGCFGSIWCDYETEGEIKRYALYCRGEESEELPYILLQM